MDKKIYAIFGASGGIGSVLSEKLSQEGHKVYLFARSKEKLQALAERLGQPCRALDATQEEQVKEALSWVLSENGQLDGVVSCVGSFLIKPLHLLSQKEFEDVMRCNATSSFCITKAATEAMGAQKRGSVVLCSSTTALMGLSSHEAISAAKAAIAGLVRSAAASYAAKGIRINAVAPGLTKTPLSQAITGNEAALKASTAFHPLGRIGEPQDVASAIKWLLQEESSWITGEVLAVDGGLSSIKTRL